jgi:hypothetical protein
MYLMLAAVENLSYANCLRKWHVELFMFYEESMYWKHDHEINCIVFEHEHEHWA